MAARGRIGSAMRRGAAVALTALVLASASPASAQDGERKALALDLARVMLDDSLRRSLDEQVTKGLVVAIGRTLQERLNRPLQDREWQVIAGIARQFVAESLPAGQTEVVAAGVYARQFDEGELRQLLDFQRSPVGQKAARLASVIAAETAEAIGAELQKSVALPRMIEQLQREFPVLRAPESP